MLDREAARRAAEAQKELLRLIPEGIERNISIKLSSLGQEISREFCLENAASILDTAKEVGGFVRLDMEGSKTTESTLDLFHELRKKYDNVGIVLQAYLHRTKDDVQEAVRRGDRVRLCKGAYKEPTEVALQAMDDIRASFRECARLLLDQGNYPALATHDEGLVQDALAYAGEQQDRRRPLRVPDALRAAARRAGRSWWRRGTTCASTCPTAPTGCRTSIGGCASAARTSCSCCGASSEASPRRKGPFRAADPSRRDLTGLALRYSLRPRSSSRPPQKLADSVGAELLEPSAAPLRPSSLCRCGIAPLWQSPRARPLAQNGSFTRRDLRPRE